MLSKAQSSALEGVGGYDITGTQQGEAINSSSPSGTERPVIDSRLHPALLFFSSLPHHSYSNSWLIRISKPGRYSASLNGWKSCFWNSSFSDAPQLLIVYELFLSFLSMWDGMEIKFSSRSGRPGPKDRMTICRWKRYSLTLDATFVDVCWSLLADVCLTSAKINFWACSLESFCLRCLNQFSRHLQQS